MKYKLPRPKISPLIIEIITKAMKEQDYKPQRISKKAMTELKKVMQVIKKQGLPDHLVLKKLPDPMGWGIFLKPDAKPILRGSLISIYGGEAMIYPQNITDESAYSFAPIDDIKLTKEEHKLIDKKNKFSPRRHYSYNVDAERKGNFTRFINHSESPNIEARLLEIPKNSLGIETSPIEVVYFAKRTIYPGQQLLVSYEDGEACYWSVLNIKPVPIVADTFTLNEQMKLVDHRKEV